MSFRLAWGALLGAALLCANGCEPKCREVEPIAEVRAEMRERIEDRLDDVDASDAQLAKVKAVFERTLPGLERFRAETHPRERAIMAELKRDQPDRARLGELIERNVKAWQAYAREIVGALVAAHPIMTRAQRKELAERASQPSEPFEGSFLLDRGVDYFLMRIDADAQQRALVERIKDELLVRGQQLRRELDALRAEAFHELAEDEPDMAKVNATIDRAGATGRRLFLDLAGYYLLVQSKLSPKQRLMLNAELVRFEPCPAAGSKGERAARSPGA